MKQLARKFVRGVLDAASVRLGRVQVARVVRAAGDRPIVALDIDNTLADAWPSFLGSWANEGDRLASLPVLHAVKAAAHDAPIASGHQPVFISHRNLWHWPVTYRWLRRNGFAATRSNVVLVAAPSHKLEHLRRCSEGRDVVYWDDLSHGHESGTVGYYDEVIAAVRDLPVDYHGYEEIVALTGPRPTPPSV